MYADCVDPGATPFEELAPSRSAARLGGDEKPPIVWEKLFAPAPALAAIRNPWEGSHDGTTHGQSAKEWLKRCHGGRK